MFTTTSIWRDHTEHCHTNIAHNIVQLTLLRLTLYHKGLPKVVKAMPKVHLKIVCYFYVNLMS
jgi:hypothetical protein